MTDYDTQNRIVEYMLGLFVVVGNAIAICVFARKKEKLPHTIFILTLAITDFLTCSVVIPMSIFLIHTEFKTDSDFLCKIYYFFITSNVPFSAFIMVAISVERYLSVCHPFLHLMNSKNTIIVIFSLFLFACSLGTTTCLAHGTYDECINGTNEPVSETDITLESLNDLDINSTAQDLEPFIKNDYCNTGHCTITTAFLSISFLSKYQKVYASLYLISFLSTLILYGLIYRNIFWRRAKRWKVQTKQLRQGSKDSLSDYDETSCNINTTEMESIQNVAASASHMTHNLVEFDNSEKEIEEAEIILNKGAQPKLFPKKMTSRDKHRIANLKLAAMLFVVNVVFVFAFLPAWLMATRVIEFHPIVFYAYFCYNVANPMIYAFMNPSFRIDMRKTLCFWRKR